MRIVTNTKMPSPKAGTSHSYLSPESHSHPTESPSSKTGTKTDQEYLEMLAKEFNSIPDREVPPPEPQDEDQLAAMNRTSVFPHIQKRDIGANVSTELTKITPRPEKDSIDTRNVVIAKTIRSAMASMRLT